MKNTIFGTDGIREKIGSEFLTPQSLFKLGRAIAHWASKKFKRNPRILIGHDTRESCFFVKSALQSGLLIEGSSVYDATIAPTPVVCNIVQNSQQFEIGIIISASHNPYYDNGIKIVCSQSGKISCDDEIAISTLFYSEKKIEYSSLGKTYSWPYALQEYLKRITSFFPVKFLSGKKIILDCANGATHEFAQHVFEHFDAHIILINNIPDGTNINYKCGSLHPESLQSAVTLHQADIGFAFDGDGDRVIVVNHQGHIKDGDDILALLLNHKKYQHQKKIVGTIMTNQGFAYFLEEQSKALIRTAVGDKYISEQLLKDSLLLGGEPSGHIIMKDYLDSGDGIFTALRLLEVIIQTNNWEIKTFNKYPQILVSIPVTLKKDLSSQSLAQIISEYHAQIQKGRLIVRYSGTEPLLRVMVEDEDLHKAERISKQLSIALAEQLSL